MRRISVKTHAVPGYLVEVVNCITVVIEFINRGLAQQVPVTPGILTMDDYIAYSHVLL